MEYMKEFPDNYFDLAIVDPPYGAGFTDGGGCQGWFSKYHQNPKTLENTDNSDRGGILQQVRAEVRQVQAGRTTHSGCENAARITRVGGTWESKYAKKS